MCLLFLPFADGLLVPFLAPFDVFVREFRVSVLGHAPLDDAGLVVQVAGGLCGVALQRGGVAGGDEGGLPRTEMLGAAMVVVLRGGLGPVDARPHLDDVEIDLHDALLAPECLDQEGVIGLQPFPHPGALGPAEHVLGRLLRDGAAAAMARAALALLHHNVQRDDVEAVVSEEVVVLRRDGRLVHVGRNLLDGLPFLLDGIPELHLADDHQGRDGRVYPSENDGEEDAQQKARQDDKS